MIDPPTDDDNPMQHIRVLVEAVADAPTTVLRGYYSACARNLLADLEQTIVDWRSKLDALDRLNAEAMCDPAKRECRNLPPAQLPLPSREAHRG